MKFSVIPVTPFEQNCTLLWCETTHKAAVVDPGGDLDLILAEVEAQGVELEKILITHAHIDHAGGAGELSRILNIPIEGPHREDAFWIEIIPTQSEMFGFPPVETFEPARWLEQGDRINVGNEELEVRHCPGHTPGHVIFFHRGEKIAMVGDVLFKGSIGRTDFPKSDHASLLNSIREQLFTLDDDIEFIPGHGPLSTIGEERRTNPFLR
ncbi:MAG: MBL fold metallo-hydrolase [Candidatus Sedimenticola sp. (ex Thyasira tokunagai)]